MYVSLKIKGQWIKLALLSFLAAALFGLSLRIGFITGFPPWIKYRYILHAHSHTAMLGWLFSALFILILTLFDLDPKRYKSLFWIIQISVLGMMIFFPIQGYGLISIAFSTLHLICSYIFMVRANQEFSLKISDINKPAHLFLRTAFLFFFLSTLGLWALGPLMNSNFKGTAVYYAAVQFFLHFQFNGWFIFGILALFFKFIGDQGIRLPTQTVKWIYWLLVISCILTYALAVSWSTPDKFIFWTNSVGVILQIIALSLFVVLLKTIFPAIQSGIASWTKFAWMVSVLALVIKIIIQGLVAVPALAKISYTIHNFVIGFIHLNMLAIISFFIIGAFHQCKLYPITSQAKKTGIVLIFAGIILSELLLFIQGLLFWAGLGFIPFYYFMIAIVSAFIPLGIILYLSNIHLGRKV